MVEIKLSSPETQERAERLALPVVEYLMSLKPTDAMHVMIAASSVMLLSLKHIEGKAALDTFDDHFAPSIRKTVECGFQPMPAETSP